MTETALEKRAIGLFDMLQRTSRKIVDTSSLLLFTATFYIEDTTHGGKKVGTESVTTDALFPLGHASRVTTAFTTNVLTQKAFDNCDPKHLHCQMTLSVNGKARKWVFDSMSHQTTLQPDKTYEHRFLILDNCGRTPDSTGEWPTWQISVRTTTRPLVFEQCSLSHDPAAHVELMNEIYTLDALPSVQPLAMTLLTEASRAKRKHCECCAGTKQHVDESTQ